MIDDNGKTQNIVSRLRLLAKTQYKGTIAFWILLLTVLVTTLIASFARDYWWLGVIIGALLGYGIGIYLAGAFTLIIEWMVQILSFTDEAQDILKSFKNDLDVISGNDL